jgi:hypothetical protein
MSHTDDDNAAPKPAGHHRQGHHRHRQKPDVRAADITLPHEKRRSLWSRWDTVMLLIATVELCFLPFALKILIIPVARRGLEFETVPFGLTLVCLLGGTLLAFILFILLCYLIRKHVYRFALTIMMTLLVFELVSYPLAAWTKGLNQQRGPAGVEATAASPAP